MDTLAYTGKVKYSQNKVNLQRKPLLLEYLHAGLVQDELHNIIDWHERCGDCMANFECEPKRLASYVRINIHI